MNAPNDEHPAERPIAEIQRPPAVAAFGGSRLWWLTGACLLVAIVLVAMSLSDPGYEITISFRLGHGVKPGDMLRFRGIDVGEVTQVELDPQNEHVIVHVKLRPGYQFMAREGTRFWIERPMVSLTRISGLETVVGARYIGVLPSDDGPRVREFTGVETPLMLLDSEMASIQIRFPEGHGLVRGDVVRHRGIVVGEVTGVELDPQFDGVLVTVQLVGSGTHLARSGSRFWIERPRLSVAEVRGLDTLVGGRYIAVSPGPPNATEQSRFEGLALPPAGELPEGGVELVLESDSRFGLQRGAQVTYRGVRIGHVTAVGLSGDATDVITRVFVANEFKDLIRDNSVFWQTSGIDLSVSLTTGLKLNTESLSSIAVGGIALATPDTPGKAVVTGHRFPLHKKSADEWLAWQPKIAMGKSLLPAGRPLPQPLRATLRWSERKLGFTRSRERPGWVTVIGGRVAAPVDLLQPVPTAKGDTILEVAGKGVELAAGNAERHGEIGLLSGFETDGTGWPLHETRTPATAEPCLVVDGTGTAHVPLTAAKIFAKTSADAWAIDGTVPFDASWHGSPVVAASDGKVVGLLSVTGGEARIVVWRK